MKRFSLALTLTFVLSASALAGQIPCDYTPPPPPPDPPAATIETSPGDTPPGDSPWDIAQQAEGAAYAGLIAVVGWMF